MLQVPKLKLWSANIGAAADKENNYGGSRVHIPTVHPVSHPSAVPEFDDYKRNCRNAARYVHRRTSFRQLFVLSESNAFAVLLILLPYLCVLFSLSVGGVFSPWKICVLRSYSLQ